MKSTKIYRIAFFELGHNTDDGSRWFTLLPVYWGDDNYTWWHDHSGLIEVAWKGRRITYVKVLWDLTEALRLTKFFLREERPLVALRHGFRCIYRGTA